MSNRARATNKEGGRDIAAERGSTPQGAAETLPGHDPLSGSNTDSSAGPGQLALDDRGNMSWEWADDPQLLADDLAGNTARLRALAPGDLELADDDIAAVNRDLASVKGQPIAVRKTQRTGYNPYNSGESTKESWKRKRDLRRLGEWIELKKRMRDKPGEG